jgi:hypothetical protein
MSHDLSTVRSQLRAAQQQLAELLEVFLGRDPLLPGSLYTLRRRCGKPHCHCTRGELHATTVLSYRGQGRPRNVTPAPEQLEPVRRLTQAYKRFRQARTQLRRLQREVLTLIDRLEAGRVQQGERQVPALRALAPSPRSRR